MTSGLRFILIALLGAAGCQSPEQHARIAAPATPREVSADVRREIQSRAWNPIARVGLLKPDPAGHAPESIHSAPLLFQDISADASPPVSRVTSYDGAVRIRGEERKQQTFVWNVVAPNGSSVTQMVRITLNAEGMPSIWEVRRDRSGADVIWVSQSLEIAASEQFGKALPGRLLSVERPIVEAPRVVVAGVVDDGPVPMGPMIYIAANGDIPLIACRCSSFEARSLEDRGLYALEAGGRGAQDCDESDDWCDPARLEKRLRLPANFLTAE